jgi:hypothetical protein
MVHQKDHGPGRELIQDQSTQDREAQKLEVQCHPDSKILVIQIHSNKMDFPSLNKY